MRRAFDLQHLVDDVPSGARKRLLELGLVVDPRRRCVLDSARERRDHGLLDPLEPVLEEQRRERRLEERRQHVAVARELRELVRRDLLGSQLDEPLPQPELPGHDRAARPRDHVRPKLRQPPLGVVRVPLEQRPGDCELEHAVPEELEALVGGGAVGRPGRVREDGIRARGRQLVDQPPELRGLAARLPATGAR